MAENKTKGISTTLTTVIGLLVSLSGNLIQFKNNQIKVETNKILADQVFNLEKELASKENVYRDQANGLKKEVDRLVNENEALEYSLDEGTIADRYRKIAQIKRNEEAIKDLRIKISEIKF